MTTRDWDAATYDRVAHPMTRWVWTSSTRLPLAGDERVMDAGCGTGRVTEQLAERLPRGHVVALDGSPAMVEAAHARLARFGERVDYIVADLGQPLPVEDPVDAILSTATFHWVPDHDALFRNLAAVTRPGGRLVAQCGGYGNVGRIKRVVASIGDGWLGPAHYETAEGHGTTARRGRLHRHHLLAGPRSRPASRPASRSRPSCGRWCSARRSIDYPRASAMPMSTRSPRRSAIRSSITCASTSRRG